jgi:hypothetical protein
VRGHAERGRHDRNDGVQNVRYSSARRRVSPAIWMWQSYERRAGAGDLVAVDIVFQSIACCRTNRQWGAILLEVFMAPACPRLLRYLGTPPGSWGGANRWKQRLNLRSYMQSPMSHEEPHGS